MKLLRKSNFWFAIIVIVYLIYAGVFIYKTSFVSHGERYFVLFDDAMISMRYARNLAQGYGPVWNPGGERVEGYTNPLWVVWMALIHLLPLPASKISLLVQISGALFLAANLFFVKRIAERLCISPSLKGKSWVALLAVILTAFYVSLNTWGLEGMEVSLLALVVSAATWLAVRSLQNERQNGRQGGAFTPWMYVLLGASTLVRVDMAVPFLVITGFMTLADRPNWRKHLAWGAGMLVLFLGVQSAFRLAYYGSLLPNTYYLKMEGYPLVSRLLRGGYVLFLFVMRFNWLLFVLPFSLLLIRRDWPVLLLFLVVLGQLAYSVYVGGDAWEHRGGANRYIAIAMPLYFVLFSTAVFTIADLFRERLLAQFEQWRIQSQDSKTQRRTTNFLETAHLRVDLLISLGAAVFILVSMVNMNSLTGDRRSLERWLLLRQPNFVEGNKEYVEIANDLRQITTPEATIAVVTAGAIPYFAERPALDLLGKNDAIIAHLPPRYTGSPFNLDKFRPGHNKWDYDYSLGQLKPDVVVQLWGDTDEAQAYIDQYYVIGGADTNLLYSLRRDSPNILWSQVVSPPEEG